VIANLSGGSYGFSLPDGVAFDGSHIWVANSNGGSSFEGSVTEVNVGDGSLVRTLAGDSYGFGAPTGMAFDGNHIWVTNRSGSGSVTQLLAP
jgi:DNA-binding beta-propeller fold protein YncE